MTDERIKEERNKTAKIIVARLLGSLEATPLNISMIETVLAEYEIKITRAADLLEAREIIKEMREQLSAVVSTESTPTTKGELVYVNNYIEMRELLEKTKEYV